MDPQSAWTHIANRIRALRSAAEMMLTGSAARGADEYGTSNAWIIPSAEKLIAEIQAFRTDHAPSLNKPTLEAIDRGLHQLQFLRTGSGIPRAVALVTALLSLEGEVTFYLKSADAALESSTERAFLHLQRLLVTDPDTKAKWASVFKQGEVACERLGACHLLQHGIYAFKTSATGEKTDLVLGSRLIVDDALRRATKGLVLTEWKIVRDDADLERVRSQAESQARRYGQGSLAGFELERTRYLILVSRENLVMSPDRIDGSTTFRHVNVAIDPATPSRQRAPEAS